MVGRLPGELFEQFDGGGFLAFDAIGIDGVEQVDGLLPNEFVENAHAAVEVGAELAGERAVVEGLRELAPGNFPVRNEHQAPHISARGVGGHGGRGVAGRGARDPAETRFQRGGGGNGHASVFERCRGIHALVLRIEMIDSHGLRAAAQVIERSIALSERDNVLSADDWQEFAKAPDAALVKGIGQCCAGRCAAAQPQSFEVLGVGDGRRCEVKFQKIAACRAAKVRGGRVGRCAARDAAETGGSFDDRHGQVAMSLPQIRVAAAHPVGARRMEDIEIDGIGERLGFVRQIGRDG